MLTPAPVCSAVSWRIGLAAVAPLSRRGDLSQGVSHRLSDGQSDGLSSPRLALTGHDQLAWMSVPLRATATRRGGQLPRPDAPSAKWEAARPRGSRLDGPGPRPPNAAAERAQTATVLLLPEFLEQISMRMTRGLLVQRPLGDRSYHHVRGPYSRNARGSECRDGGGASPGVGVDRSVGHCLDSSYEEGREHVGEA